MVRSAEDDRQIGVIDAIQSSRSGIKTKNSVAYMYSREVVKFGRIKFKHYLPTESLPSVSYMLTETFR